MLLLAYVDQVIDDHEFVLLFDVNEEKNPEFPYWTSTQFYLDKLGTMNAVMNLDSGRMTYMIYLMFWICQMKL